MATSSAAIVVAAERCSTISKALPGHGSNVRLALRRARKRGRPRRWFRRSRPRRLACGSSSSIPKNAKPMSAASATRRWSVSAPGLRSSRDVSPRDASEADEKIRAAAGRILARNHGHRLYERHAVKKFFRDQHFFSSCVSRGLVWAQFCIDVMARQSLCLAALSRSTPGARRVAPEGARG